MLAKGNDPVFVGNIISKKDLDLNPTNNDSNIFFQYNINYTTNTFTIIVYNNINVALRCLVKLEALSI
jgi:hypothetical protein